ncbi:hypothetical protein Amet_3244 [Alkaliphilus metalliredigens QYMF]|uniref:Uncharacterized protein n=1 Tax=Alkaliphilus metalliredigens (strain QYMF) TaxID=293826 RepID=A6TT64_ALKMQ|nr:hypothetical protein Amet_3244 [Alkaliphilus metalliredigens QYMF]
MDIRENIIPMIARLPKYKLESMKTNMLCEYLCIETPGLPLEIGYFLMKKYN